MACIENAANTGKNAEEIVMCTQPDRLLDFEACLEGPEEATEWERNGLLFSQLTSRTNSLSVSRASSVSEGVPDAMIDPIGGRRPSAQSSTTAGTDTTVRAAKELERIKAPLLTMNNHGVVKVRSSVCPPCCGAAAFGAVSALAVAAWLRRGVAGAALHSVGAMLQETPRWATSLVRPELEVVSAAPPLAPVMPRRHKIPPGRPSICNLAARTPSARPLRKWRLDPGWKRVCEKANQLPASQKRKHASRNWCWFAIKQACYSSLKGHKPWALLQNISASWGEAPPRSAEPFDPLEAAEICDKPRNGRVRNWTSNETAEAREWFKNNVAVYVLGMFSDLDRWHMISNRLKDLRIWATHVPGVDMRDPNALETAKTEGWIPLGYNFSRAQAIAYQPPHFLGSMLGTLGCATAHFRAQEKIRADGTPLAVVFEDDSWPTEDFVERLWSLVRQELPCDWEVTSLYSRCPYGICVSEHLSRVQPDGNEPAWQCRHGVNWGMQAVLYRTEVLPRVQEVWKRAVFDEERPHCMDVDVALAAISDEVSFYAVPAVQDPGFLKETNHPSLRYGINKWSAAHPITKTKPG